MPADCANYGGDFGLEQPGSNHPLAVVFADRRGRSLLGEQPESPAIDQGERAVTLDVGGANVRHCGRPANDLLVDRKRAAEEILQLLLGDPLDDGETNIFSTAASNCAAR